MCGIAGILSVNSKEVFLERLNVMSDKIIHRGPDGRGAWISDDGLVGLAHRRLAIIDLDESAGQPMHYLDRYSIVFNGEIYNYIELREMLLSKGYSFKTQSDTEVVLALYDLKKEKLLTDLEGMFALVIYDNLTKTLFCARDRFGEKPFFYFHDKEKFVFASELKALWVGGVKKSVNPKLIYLYLAYGTQQNLLNPEESFFKNVMNLEPAHFLIIDKNNLITKSRYWDIDLTNRNDEISYKNASEKFMELFTESIAHRLRADVPVGSSLSGGLDSSSIVMLIDKIKSGMQIQKTFSARFIDFSKDEGDFIKMVVDKSKVESHEVFLSAEKLQALIEDVAYHQEEPFGSTSVIAQWEVMKLAKENNVTVLLDGQGADEILAGYFHYFGNYFSSLLLHDNSEFWKQRKLYKSLYGVNYSLGSAWLLDTVFTGARPKLRGIKNILKLPDYLKQFNGDFYSEYKYLDFGFEHKSSLNEGLYFVLMKGGLQNLLRYADRNSMAHSLEVRLPFLSYKLVEFVFSLPDSMKLHNGWTKFLLRNSMKNILPDDICWRKEKVGFEPPKGKQVPLDLMEASLDSLFKHNILDKNSISDACSWEYVQIATLLK